MAFGYVVQSVVLDRLTRRRVARRWFTVGIMATTIFGLGLLIAGVAATELGLVVCGLVLLGVVAYGSAHRVEKLRPYLPIGIDLDAGTRRQIGRYGASANGTSIPGPTSAWAHGQWWLPAPEQ